MESGLLLQLLLGLGAEGPPLKEPGTTLCVTWAVAFSKLHGTKVEQVTH